MLLLLFTLLLQLASISCKGRDLHPTRLSQEITVTGAAAAKEYVVFASVDKKRCGFPVPIFCNSLLLPNFTSTTIFVEYKGNACVSGWGNLEHLQDSGASLSLLESQLGVLLASRLSAHQQADQYVVPVHVLVIQPDVLT